MKKIFLFFAAAMTALSMNAQTELTPSQARQKTFDEVQAGETGTELVRVIGYVTDASNVSRGQQTLWMDDQKGDAKTFQGYWANIPDENDPINKGDKIALEGYLLNYNGTTAEIKNGNVTILERVVVNRDTLDYTVCEALEEGLSLNAGETTDDELRFRVRGIIDQVVSTNDSYMQMTFWMTCEETGEKLEAYNCYVKDSKELAQLGDEVEVIGTITNYNGTIEITNGYIYIVNTDGRAQTIKATVAEIVEAGMKLDKNETDTKNIYVVEGYIAEIADAWTEQYKNLSFYMGDTPDDARRDFEVFRGKYATDDLKVGDKIFVKGQIQHYYKEATDEKPEIDIVEMISGATISLTDPTTGVEKVIGEVKAMKIMKNGQVIIVKDDVEYNVLGTQIR